MTALNDLLPPVTTIVPRHRTSPAVERWLDFGLVAGLLLVVGVVTGWGLNHYPALNGDEGIYTAQAHAVIHGSLSPYTYTYDHPFFGWLQIAGLAQLAEALRLGGKLSVVNTRYVMLLLTLINVPLLYGIARRLEFPRVFAGLTVLLFALSPLTVDLARQVYLDNIALTWVLLAFFLMLNRQRNTWLFAASGASFAIAVLSKETVVLLLPALAYLLYQRTRHSLRTVALTAATAMFTLLVLIYPVFALLRNELLPGAGHVSLWTNGIVYQLASRSSSGALWHTGTARRQLWDGWLTFDKVLIYLGLGAVVASLFTKRMRPIAVAALLVLLPIIKPGGYLPAMYVVVLLPFLALCIGGTLSEAWSGLVHMINHRKTRWGYLLIVPSVALFALVVTSIVGLASAKYSTGDRMLMTANAVQPAVQTEDWLIANVSPRIINGERSVPNVLTDDAFSTDLYRMGLTPWEAVSYYKYDLDPTATKELPDAYRDITFIVDTPQMRSDISTQHLTKTETAIQHSTVIATFGTGDARIEIRQVTS